MIMLLFASFIYLCNPQSLIESLVPPDKFPEMSVQSFIGWKRIQELTVMFFKTCLSVYVNLNLIFLCFWVFRFDD